MRIHFIATVCIGMLMFVFLVQPKSNSVNELQNTPISSTVTTTPEQSDRFFTYPLTCPANLVLREGLSWRGITIGRSTSDELNEVYGVIASRVEPIEKGNFAPIYSITLTSKASRERKLAASMEACFIGWKVAVLALSGDSDEFATPTVQYWIAQYGIPDIITWSYSDWGYRTLVWPKVGLALEVRLDDRLLDLKNYPYTIYAETIIFFPPISRVEDLLGWPYSGLIQTLPTVPNDGGYPTVADPFNFEVLVSTEEPTLAATANS
jgi:hypothetical protein